MLELLCSPPGTGKTSYCIELFKNEILKSPSGIDSRSFFVLPSREHAERIQNLILKPGQGSAGDVVAGLFNAHILTINDLASRLIGFSTATHPTDASRRIILDEILDGKEMSWSAIGSSVDFKGFRRLVLDHVKEFKEGLLTVKEFENLCQPLLKDPIFRSKFRDLSVILKKYDKKLDELGLSETADDIAALLKENRPAGKIGLVIFDGFYHFTRAQQALISAVARSAAERTVVTLTLPADGERSKSLFEYPERTRAFLNSIGFKEKKNGFEKNYRTENAALLHLERNLFLKKPAAFSGDVPGSIRIFEAASVRQEAEMIAREIRGLYSEGNFHYSDLCVILRSLKGYEKVIQAVFEQYHIPVFIHERQRLIEKGLTLTLKAFLNLIQEDWKREDLFFFLKSSYLKETVAEEGVWALEKIAYAKNIRQGRKAWLEILSFKEADSATKQALLFVREWEEKILASKNAVQLCRSLKAMLEIMKEARGGSADDPLHQAMEKSLREVIENTGRLSGERAQSEFSVQNFVKTLEECLEAALFSYHPQGRNRVQVYDVVMALPKEYKVVFLSGLLERSFPVAVSEDPLLKDEERSCLNRNGTVLEERAWRAGGEKYFFYMGVARAKEKLYLTYPLYNSEGKSSLPSFFVGEVQKCFRGRVPAQRKSPGDFMPSTLEWSGEADVTQGLAEILFQKRSLPASSLGGLETALFSERVTRKNFRDILHYGLNKGEAVILDPAARKLFRGDTSLFSATRLEMFATCAFKHFSKRMLNLTEPMENREFIEKGNMLHKTLEAFYRGLTQEQRADPAFWEDSEKPRQLLFKHLDEALREGPFLNEPLYRQRVYRDSLRRALGVFASREKFFSGKREFVPSYFEWNFGGGRGQDAERLVLKESSGDISVEGRIDRIDLSRDGKKALVIDYKLSPREMTLSERWRKGIELQLPLYLLAVSRLLKREVVGAELRFLQSSDSKPKEGLYRDSAKELLGLHSSTKTKSEEEWTEILQGAEGRTRAYVARMRDADIRVKSKTCKHCSYHSVCRFEGWKLIYSEGE